MSAACRTAGTSASILAAQHGAKTVSVSYSGVDDSAVGSTGTTMKNMDALLIWAAGNAGSQLSNDWQDVIIAGATDQASVLVHAPAGQDGHPAVAVVGLQVGGLVGNIGVSR